MTSLPTTTTTQVPTTFRPDAGPLRPALAPRPAAGLGAGQIFSMLLRHIWLIITVFVVVMLIDAGLFFGLWKFDREYTARGAMRLVDPPNPMRAIDPRLPDRFTIERDQREQAMKVKNPSTITELLKQPAAAKWAWVRKNQGTDEDPVDLTALFEENVDAGPIRDSGLVEVSFSDSDRAAAVEIVNELMSFYVDKSSSESTRISSDTRKAVQAELDKVQYNLGRVEGNLKTLRESKDYEGLEKARSEVIDRVALLAQLEQQAILSTDNYERQTKTLAEQMKDPAWVSPDIQGRVNSNPILAQFIARRQALIEERAQLQQRGLLENHTAIKEINVRLAEVEGAIRDKQVELVDLEKARSFAQVAGAAESVKAQLATIQDNLREAREKKRTLEVLWAQSRALETEKEEYDAQRQHLLSRLREIDVRISQRVPEVIIFNLAVPPRRDEISWPRWEIFLAVGIILGLGLAIGLAVVIELADTSVRTPRDLSEQVRLPLLGFVPMVDNASLPREKLCRLVAAEPMSLIAESFRQIRTNLLFAAPADQLHSIAFTSAASDEGKTAVACNLAITIALSGRKVLLIDANFRRPALAEVFGLDHAVGLSNVLTNQATLADAVQATDVPNLSVIVTGPPPPNPAELLGSASMRQLLDQTDAEFDLVLFDAPPALLVTDALVLGSMVDGVVIVVRAVETSRGTVARLRDQLGKVNARIIGAVLNAARPTRGGYFRKSQQQYEEYLGTGPS